MILYGNDLKFSGLTCLYFYAESDILHIKYKAMISKFVETNKEINFIWIDAFNYADIAKRYNINVVPTLVFINEKEIKRFSGITNKKSFNSFCENIIKEKNERREKRRKQERV